MTIKDIANIAKVSVTTVSRVLNNKPDVSAKTKKKVLDVIDELGYNPNGVARGLVLQKTFTIGMIIPDITNPFFPEIARGIENGAKQRGYSVIFCNTDNDRQSEKDAINLLKSKQVDGMILSLSMDNEDELKKLEESNLQVVQIDRIINDSPFSGVTIDNELSAYQGVRYLIEQNHRHIAHITGDLHTQTGLERLEGYKRALNESNLPVCAELIQVGDYSIESGYEQMKTILKHDERPTAIFAANDLMAIGAFKAIFESDLRIPEDISVMGHDGIDVASITIPSLTTMVQPKYKLGQRAAELLIQEIESDARTSQKIILETELRIGSSTREWK